ncbi:MAG: D-alanyl-D-alanine carboxypeptidase family protein [Faecalibacterium sp.]
MERRTIALFCTLAFTFWLFALCVHSSNMQVATVSTTQDALAQSSESAQQSSDAILLTALADSLAADATLSNITLPEMPTLSLACSAAVLIDQSTGTILYAYNADEQRAVASITKVMTLLLTFEAIQAGEISLSDTVPISSHAFSMGGSQIWLEPGEVFTLEELIKAVCVSSANDAAVAIAEYVGGSEEAFVGMMNARAAELGLENTIYQNACGLDEENHLSSARDVAVLSCYILEHCPEVLTYTGIWTDTLRDGATYLTNTNKLLNYYEGITGLKTGTTGDAGICISASATRDGLSLVAVVLGSSSSSDRFHSAITMLDYGFATFEAAAVPQSAGAPATQFVKGGAVETVALDYSAVPATLLLEKGGGSALRTEVLLYDDVTAPLTVGTQLGEVQLYSEDTLLAQYPIAASENVEKLTVTGAMQALWLNLCTG